MFLKGGSAGNPLCKKGRTVALIKIESLNITRSTLTSIATRSKELVARFNLFKDCGCIYFPLVISSVLHYNLWLV